MTLKIHNTDLLKGLENNELIINHAHIKHLFEKPDLMAVWSAFHAGRPLLLRGKPGTGKSQLAKAIAHKLGWAFVSQVMHGTTELDELHWHYDAINRLGEAQSLAYRSNIKPDNAACVDDSAEDKKSVSEILDHKNYIRPSAFWWAFDWKKARQHLTHDKTETVATPHTPANWNEEKDGVVLLIDEIDKAQPDLPNGLLQTLGDLSFNVPYINEKIQADPSRLLIIITTNEERELPTAFVRRCYTHTLKMEEGETDRIEWLTKRGKLHFESKIHDDVYQQAAELLWKDRQSHKRYPPSLAEYLDLLRPLSTIDKAKQGELLTEISGYAYNKEAED